MNVNEILQVETENMPYLKIRMLQKYQYAYLHCLRNLEYYYWAKNCSSIFRGYYLIMYIIWHTLWKHWSVKTGITIPKNVCEEGLTIYHWGSIVVNSEAHIGRNCCIMNNVNIGTNGGGDKAPRIGHNVYIGPGAVLYGDIVIADGCYIGANAVVNKSFTEPSSIIAGVPAKVIGHDEVLWWEKNRMQRNK